MTHTKASIKQKLLDSRAYLDAVLDQVGDRQQAQVYSDGLGWTVRQLVVHLANADTGHNNQAMNIAEGRDIIPEDFDLQRYNQRTTEKLTEKTFEQARAELAESRVALMAWLDEVDEAKLQNKGRHASLHIMTVFGIMEIQADHERTHAADIASALSITV